MKKVGIYGGSFNPIHFGHIGVAKWVLENTDLDEVWLMVSPNNPLKDKNILAPEELRFMEVQEAIKDMPGLVASDFEFSLSRPSYMSRTLYELCMKYPEYKFTLIIGEDSLLDFNKWHHFDYILHAFRVFVYPRKVNFNTVSAITDLYKECEERRSCVFDLQYLKGAPLFDISSTEIRNRPHMTEELYEWLREQWRRNNIPKYQHYFEPWVKNLTNSQIHYFSKQKENIENGSLTNWITKR